MSFWHTKNRTREVQRPEVVEARQERFDDRARSHRRAALSGQLDSSSRGGSFRRFRIRAGDRVGKLVAETQLTEDGKAPKSTGHRWVFRCDCGGTRERSVNLVNQDIRQGRTPRCQACSEAARRDNNEWLDIRRRENFRDLWEAYKSLYSPIDVAHLEDGVLDDLEAEFGLFVPDRLRAEPDFTAEPQALPAPWGVSRDCSLQEVGEALGVTRERARQIEASALEKMRKFFLRHRLAF